jgi:hypothetical protein
MNCKLFVGVFLVLFLLIGCKNNPPEPKGIYKYTSHNTGKSVLLDFRENGEVDVQVTHADVSGKIVDDSFFPFFTDGQKKYRWQMESNGRRVRIYNETGFEIVKLEYNGKFLSWDKTKFTKE